VHVCIYEDALCGQFNPLTLMRPVYLLRPGMQAQYRRIARWTNAGELSLAVRAALAPVMSQYVTDLPFNIIKKPPAGGILFVNGRLRKPGDLTKRVKEAQFSTLFANNGETAAVLLTEKDLQPFGPVTTAEEYGKYLAEAKEEGRFAILQTTAELYHYNWEIMDDVGDAITEDFDALTDRMADVLDNTSFPGVHILAPERVRLAQGVRIMPGSVLDATGGPIVIGPNTVIESHMAIYGPAFVGANCRLVVGKISSSSIGHTSRVGGEVEHSVFHAYVNKYHAGFIGHSYVGPWVNFGAMTTNSDLKNNYSTIKCTLNGEHIDTGSIKVGSFIGDHTKFGIGTLLNTGINIGVSCNLYQYHFDKALETAARSMARRNVELSDAERTRLKQIFEGNLSVKGVFEV
jgi:UDP-N-acetylglucosamine diphosphorylase/glucosamine-1-phosphate N-acetyltransferase